MLEFILKRAINDGNYSEAITQLEGVAKLSRDWYFAEPLYSAAALCQLARITDLTKELPQATLHIERYRQNLDNIRPVHYETSSVLDEIYTTIVPALKTRRLEDLQNATIRIESLRPIDPTQSLYYLKIQNKLEGQ